MPTPLVPPAARRTLLLGLLPLAAACAAPRGFVCPARGGPTWREVTSPSFVLQTDLDEPDARALAAQLERQRAAVAQAAGLGDRHSPGRLEVLAFATQREFAEWATFPGQAGLFYRDGFGRQRAVIGGGLDAELRRLVAHELAHFLTSQVTIRQPRWYSEGWAQYLESVSRSEGSPRAGVPPDNFPQALERSLLPARDVLSWRGTELVAEHAYPSSWLLVHYLVDTWPREFASFQRRLALAEDPAAAWNATFPGWSLAVPGATEALDRELRRYLDAGRFPSVAVTPPAGAPPLAVRTLGAGAVHAARIELARVVRRHRLRPEVEEAIAEDPGHVEALRDEAMRAKGTAAALARKAVKAHPEDPDAWAFLAETLGGEADAAEREAALRKAVELAPEAAEHRSSLALALVRSRRGAEAAEAVDQARRAVALAPWSPRANVVLATALVAHGRCEEAVAAGWRAVEMLGDASPVAAHNVGQDVAALSAQCGGGTR